MIEFVNSEGFEAEVLKADVPVLADFYSESCVPCKRLSPVLAELDAQYEGKIKTVKIKAGASFDLAEKYNVTATPTVIIFVNGKETERLTGFANKEELERLISKYI